MKLAVVGSRTFIDYSLLKDTLLRYTITEIISGGASGADALGERFADDFNIPTRIFHPDWKKYGKTAGFIRNVDIVKHCDGLIAFWDGFSKGTKHSIDIARAHNKLLDVVYFIKA